MEEAATKPSFRRAWRYSRCLIPAGGYYKWTSTKSPKQPHFFSSTDNEETLWLAGLLSVWNDLRTCAILTRAANDTVPPIHDRMPLLLDSAERNDWLSGPDQADLGVA
ncbi:SOS response-associated peptidase [Roseovarius mucosus]|uniref:SOS response-associated peptidase n=1 Tax=Roseovarius mucosus TaxID=215743 RepID=UPI003F72749D